MSEPIAEQMTDNEALRYIVAELRAQNAVALGRYDSVIGARNIVVNDSTPYNRAAQAKALKTLVTNQGALPVNIFEAGKLVYLLAPKDTWVSPLAGAGAITVSCNPGDYSTLAIATYLSA